MAKKQYDPLWEIVDEKVALQGGEPDVDSLCPYCHVRVHIGLDLQPGERVECGLCGGFSEIVRNEDLTSLKPVE